MYSSITHAEMSLPLPYLYFIECRPGPIPCCLKHSFPNLLHNSTSASTIYNGHGFSPVARKINGYFPHHFLGGQLTITYITYTDCL